MEYIEEVGYIVQADEYLKSFLFKIFHCIEEHGKRKMLLYRFHNITIKSESIRDTFRNQSIFDADVLLRTVMEGTIIF